MLTAISFHETGNFFIIELSEGQDFWYKKNSSTNILKLIVTYYEGLEGKSQIMNNSEIEKRKTLSDNKIITIKKSPFPLNIDHLSICSIYETSCHVYVCKYP
jgi:hypothetical protein